MKIILGMSLLAFTLGCNAGTASPAKTLPVHSWDKLGLKADPAKTKTDVKVEEKKEADCDKKAKETVEIKEESISLTGNTGCSLDEVNP